MVGELHPPPRVLAVEMRAISKRYARCVANHGARLEVRTGEVHAVVGENGAGKSTLMKILYGLVPPDAGEVIVRGQALVRHGPREAIAAGVGMVFQHFMLVPPLTVAENIVLGREPRRGLVFDRRAAVEAVRKVSQRFGLDIDPEARAEDCSVGLQQRIEILKVLYRGAEVVILDEPTAVLTPQEVDELITVLRRLAADGKSIILITHKLREVLAAADRITVMRGGETVETVEAAATSVEALAESMVGRRPALGRTEPPRRDLQGAGAPALSVRGLVVRSDRGLRAVAGVDLDVRPGEIVGIAGIEGNGQTELLDALAGLRRAEAGTIALGGVDVTAAPPRARIAAGLAHVPEDRHKRAVILDFDLEENTILGSQRAFFAPLWRRTAAIRAHALAVIEAGGVRPPDPGAMMRSLSGGNQQKVVIARELLRAPKVLLAAHPTRGLDIGAVEGVHRALRAARATGAAILLLSAELGELLALSDRMLVMFGGRIAGEVDPTVTSERALGALMAGEGAR